MYVEWNEGYYYTDYVPWNLVNSLPAGAVNRIDITLINEDGTIIQGND